MNSRPLAVVGSGAVTGVGMDAPSSCAAIRANVDNFQETRFSDSAGEWVLGCEVPLDQRWRGITRLAKILSMAIRECVGERNASLTNTPIVLCLAEAERPGRSAGFSGELIAASEEELGTPFSDDSSLIEYGRVGPLVGLQRARNLIYEGGFEKVIVAGVDSLLSQPALSAFEDRGRLLTSENSNGFIPGEAAAALLVEAPETGGKSQLRCLGLGFGVEHATIDSEEPLRAQGLSHALADAFSESKISMDEVDFRVVDAAGEHYWFKETALVVGRFLRVHKERFPLWHVTDCIGEVGAATGLVSIAYVNNAFEKKYADGEVVLQHLSNDNTKRAAAVFVFTGGGR